MTGEGDIVGLSAEDWLVVGWFTPDYLPLAEKFASNLSEYGISFHLFAKHKPKGVGFDSKAKGPAFLDTILLKPTIVLQAMAAYPDKTVILMDVDCIVRGGIAPLLAFDGDVAVAMFAGMRSNKPKDWQIAFGISTRVVVFHPTERALLFANRWADMVATHGGHEERCMAFAYLASPDVRFSHMALEYSGREVSDLPDGIILHQSANDALINKKQRGRIKKFLVSIERRFLRTGRTGRNKRELFYVSASLRASEPKG